MMDKLIDGIHASMHALIAARGTCCSRAKLAASLLVLSTTLEAAEIARSERGQASWIHGAAALRDGPADLKAYRCKALTSDQVTQLPHMACMRK